MSKEAEAREGLRCQQVNETTQVEARELLHLLFPACLLQQLLTFSSLLRCPMCGHCMDDVCQQPVPFNSLSPRYRLSRSPSVPILDHLLCPTFVNPLCQLLPPAPFRPTSLSAVSTSRLSPTRADPLSSQIHQFHLRSERLQCCAESKALNAANTVQTKS